MEKSFLIKKIFNEYFVHHSYIENDRIMLRLYNPDEDEIYSKYSPEDWNMIFYNVDEKSFKEMGRQFIDRVILVAIDKNDDNPFGFICIQESHDIPMEVCFHGGTWRHDTKSILLEYNATDCILQFMLDKNFNIKTTCYISNIKADRFLKSLGLVEYKVDEKLSYKYLDISLFKSNIIRNRRGVNGIIS